jgi:hypothetical protein
VVDPYQFTREALPDLSRVNRKLVEQESFKLPCFEPEARWWDAMPTEQGEFLQADEFQRLISVSNQFEPAEVP